MFYKLTQHFRLIVFLFLATSFCIPSSIMAQPAERMIKVVVSPDHSNWEYKIGEKAKFSIMVLKDGNKLDGINVSYKVMPEKMEPIVAKTKTLENGVVEVEGLGLTKPGFLRCVATVTVDGREYSSMATVGFAPHLILPTVASPADFDQFWSTAIAESSKLPMDVNMQFLPSVSTENVNVYQVSIQSYNRHTRVYGILCVPKKKGKYPAILKVPGAGARPHTGDIATAEKGFITLDISIHGIPVNLDPVVYQNLMTGALKNYMTSGLDDKDQYYYKRVYLGCLRANDFLVSLPEYDGSNLGVMGGSQGGALSIVTASLDSRVKYLVAIHPALSDLTGYLHGRAGGWPHLFDKNNAKYHQKPDKIATVGYYDVVNFAKRLKVPGYYTWGFNDDVCPPTSMYSFFNTITAPKQLYLALEVGHWTYPEQNDIVMSWLQNKLKSSTSKR
ncbi:MAG: acetylxylan esterase [Pedobacter sp.]|nr:MAG: acetylxylan esterase [Pedobacter sp.]